MVQRPETQDQWYTFQPKSEILRPGSPRSTEDQGQLARQRANPTILYILFFPPIQDLITLGRTICCT